MIRLTSHLFANLSVPANEVWEVVADFGSMRQWWPAGLLSRIEIEGAGIGMVRALHTTIGTVVRERLEALDPDEHRIELSIHGDLPVGIGNYTATGFVTATGPDTCRLDWTGRYEVPNRSAERAAREFVEGTYSTMFRGIREFVTKHGGPACTGPRER